MAKIAHKSNDDLKISSRKVDELIPYPRNARTHSEEQIKQIAESIREFGWTSPLIVSGNHVIAGHGRLLAAKQLGETVVPVVNKADLTDKQRRALILVDNKIAENAGWDENLLALELDELSLEFDMRELGFPDLDPEPLQDKLGVKRVESGPVDDQFWISIRGPLVHQAQALRRLSEVMKELPIEIELGTTPREPMGESSL